MDKPGGMSHMDKPGGETLQVRPGGPPSHGSGSGWYAIPFLHGSFIRYSMPVFPGAIQASRLVRRSGSMWYRL
jgi:hypothetical protein